MKYGAAAFLLSFCTLLPASHAAEQTYPSKPIRIIAPRDENE